MLVTALASATVARAAIDAAPQTVPTTAQETAQETTAQEAPAPTPTTPPATLPVEEHNAQRFVRGKNLFDYGDCPGAIAVLQPLAVPGNLGDERDQLEVHRVLGICHALAGQDQQSAREFSSLLAINPDYALDTFVTPPAAVVVFSAQKALMKVQLDEIRRAKSDAKSAGLDFDNGVLVEREQTVRELPLAAVFLPFGFAQAANGETVKGIVFGGVQATLLAVNVGAYWGLEVMKFRRIQTGAELTAQTVLWSVHLGALMGFALGYGTGVADAMWNREDRIVVDKKQSRRALTPEEVSKLRAIAPTPARTGPLPAPP